jgi:hypothetical protein
MCIASNALHTPLRTKPNPIAYTPFRTLPQVAPLALGRPQQPANLVTRVVLLSFDGSPQQLLDPLAEFACAGTEVVVVREGGAPEGWQQPGKGRCKVR